MTEKLLAFAVFVPRCTFLKYSLSIDLPQLLMSVFKCIATKCHQSRYNNEPVNGSCS